MATQTPLRELSLLHEDPKLRKTVDGLIQGITL